ncbi:hypothetical protein SAMN05216312_110249 [Cohnella sp. OV330]|nr:hypothetical protein SAMN05216312_110249 [Cohnella sp. OV330]
MYVSAEEESGTSRMDEGTFEGVDSNYLNPEREIKTTWKSRLIPPPRMIYNTVNESGLELKMNVIFLAYAKEDGDRSPVFFAVQESYVLLRSIGGP